ncbi:mate-domain-containing protein [Ramicandelaber brevisporus]|nr:mate-domain-containing protein [Ramicandelaber brevisporus]
MADDTSPDSRATLVPPAAHRPALEHDSCSSSNNNNESAPLLSPCVNSSPTILPTLASEALSLLTYALPMMYIISMIMFLQITAIGATGTLGKEALAAFASGRAISTLFAFAPMMGLGTMIETLCSQSFTGAADTNPRLTGYWFQRLFVIVTIMFVAIEACLWKSEWLFRLVFSTNTEQINRDAVVFLRWDILCYYISAVADSYKRFLFAQDIKAPSVLSVSVAVPVCVLSSSYLVSNPAIGVSGAPISICLAYVAHLTTMVVYVKVTGCCKDTWGGWNWHEATRDWQLFVTLGVPAALTLMVEYGTQEIITIASAQLNPLALVVHPIVAATLRMGTSGFTLPVGMAAAARVGHALGDSNARRTKRVAFVGTVICCAVSAFASVVLFVYRLEIAQYYSNQHDVVALTSSLFQYIAVVVLLIGMNNGFNGILRGKGRQPQILLFKVAGYYVVSLPVGYFLAFRREWGVYGLWSAMGCGSLATTILQVWWILGTDWDMETLLCQKRLGKSVPEVDTTTSDDDNDQAIC